MSICDERPANLALQLTSGGLVVARLRARHHCIGPLAAERGRWADEQNRNDYRTRPFQ
jgi:hypothetical protein